jgi:hypothetical protein
MWYICKEKDEAWWCKNIYCLIYNITLPINNQLNMDFFPGPPLGDSLFSSSPIPYKKNAIIPYHRGIPVQVAALMVSTVGIPSISQIWWHVEMTGYVRQWLRPIKMNVYYCNATSNQKFEAKLEGQSQFFSSMRRALNRDINTWVLTWKRRKRQAVYLKISVPLVTTSW